MKAWTQVPAGDINAANQRLWVAIGDNAEKVAARINTDPAFVANIARLMVNGGYKLSTSQKLARKIMGRNFFGIEEAIIHFGVNATKQQLAYLAEVPFSKKQLSSCQDTHLLVAVFPMSILDIRGKVERKLLFRHGNTWYKKEVFAEYKGKASWHLVRKFPVDEETSKAQVVVYTIIGYFLQTGKRLLENIFVRCSDVTSNGERISIGYFDIRGLHIYPS